MKLRHLLFGLLAGVAFVACTNDNEPAGVTPADGNKVATADKYISVNLKTPGSAATRAETEAATEAENEVKKATFLFFKGEDQVADPFTIAAGGNDANGDAWTPGTAATKALSGETAASISGVAESLADSSDIATKVATYVGGVVAAEAARADAEVERAIKSLDVADTAQAGKYVSQVVETDGKIAVSRANVSDAVLTGYAKGTAPASLDIAATDDVKTAIAKLEHQVDAAEAAAAAGATVVAEGTDAGNNMTIAETTDQTDGHKTYTINLTDVASAQGLADEITRAQTAEGAIDTAVGLTKASGSETRSFTPTTNYGGSGASAATSVMDNMQKLDTQLKAVSDAAAAIQYKVNGTTLEFYGMTEHA